MRRFVLQAVHWLRNLRRREAVRQKWLQQVRRDYPSGGRCHGCGRQTEPGSVECDECREMYGI